MSHNNPSKERGQRWESAVAEYLWQQGHTGVERRAQRGRNDAGDIAGVPGWVIGCKDEQRIQLPLYMDELEVQRVNAFNGNTLLPWGVQIVKRRRAPVKRAYVVCELGQFSELLKEFTA